MALKTNPDDLNGLKKVFKFIDDDHNGSISIQEVKKINEKYKIDKNMTGPQWEVLLKKLDLDGNGKIDFREFVTACVDHKNYLTQQNIDDMFTLLDKDGDEHISMKEFDFYLPSSKWDDIIDATNIKQKDEGVSKAEFERVLKEFRDFGKE